MTADSEIKTNILLVDDRPQNLLALRAILEPLGQNLIEAESGESALRNLLDTEFAVILLDVLMPGLDGFQTAAMIKEREKTRHTPIIFLTAVAQPEHSIFRGYDVGAVDYITKPFHPDILRSKVSVFIDLYRKKEQLRRQGELLRQNERREGLRALAEQKRLGEQRYQELAESMPQIVWTADPKGNLTYCNQRCVDFTGLGADELRDRGWQAVLHPEDADLFVRGWSQAVRAGTNYEASHRLKSAADGTARWHLWRAVPIRDNAGEIASWIGTSTDIDEQKRAADALSFLAGTATVLASSMDYRSTLSRLPALAVPELADWCAIDLLEEDRSIQRVGFLHQDPEQQDLMVAMIARFPPSLATRRGLAKVIATGEVELVRDVDDDVLADLSSSPDHLDNLRKLQLRSYVCAPLVARGRVLGAITLGTSESRRRYGREDRVLAEHIARRIANAIDNAYLYEMAERERAALEQASRARDEFLAVVSHELRSPLNSILGWVQILRTGSLDTKQTDHGLETIERNVWSQAQLIGDLLDASRIITGKLHLNIQMIDLVGVIEAALDSVRPAIQAKNIELMTALDRSTRPLAGDADRLQQVAWNLLSNAIKFTPRGGRIDVRLKSAGDHVTLEVRDTGSGIRADFLPYLFERFRQADSSTTRTHGGLGLGLSIVRNLVELHGGEVRAESEGEGRGATFFVELPCNSTAKPTSRNAPKLPSTQPKQTPGSELPGLHILLVEDMPDARELFKTMVERAGAQVVAVSSVEEALRAMEDRVPDVLVSDISLPVEDGYTLLAKVRALPPQRGGHVPAIAMTANVSERDRKRALASGFQGYIAKPVDRSALLSMIHQVARASLNPAAN
jgi:PAS domain S-box-containing protein